MNKEIRCPKCGTVIQIDEETYDSIARQVKDQEYFNAVENNKAEMQRNMNNAIKAAEAAKEASLRAAISAKDADIQNLQQQISYITNKANKVINDNKAQYSSTILASSEQIASLQKELSLRDQMQKSAIADAVAAEQQRSHDKDIQINTLQQQLKSKESEATLKVSKACSEKDREVAKLQAQIASDKASYIASEKALKDKYDTLLKSKDEEVKYYRDFKAKQSVKLLGESLEEHCAVSYDTVRTLMPTAVFQKDNTVSSESNSKGDFIYRDYYDCEEYISIMFEMKNESVDATHKHKNADFFKELDKDRREKKCEYAILVSMLESESEVYNRGIVDVSHLYPKMYVIRPQFFIPMLTLLRNAALKSVSYKRKLADLEKQNIDVSTFENDLDDYKAQISKNAEAALKKKNSAITQIDKVISVLQEIKDDFASFDKNMELANKKAQKLTIHKLTTNAPAVGKMIESTSAAENSTVDHAPTVTSSEPASVHSISSTPVPPASSIS